MFQDVRFALRLFRRNPVSTAIVLLSIALSVGATSVIFTAIKAVLIDPLPYARPSELVQLRGEYPKMQEQSNGDWTFWNETQEVGRRTRTLESVGVYRNAVFDLAGSPDATPEALYGLKVTANLFSALGVSPMLGRNILPEEDQPGHSNEMVLSYGLWARRFNSDPAVVGRTVTVNGHSCLIIGVMPQDFNFPLRRQAAHTPSPYVEFWAPLSPNPGSRDGGLGAVARLRPGVTLEQARQDLASISGALSHDFPDTNRDRTLRLNLLRDRTVGIAKNGLLILMAASVLFMLIGCANVANLLLARGLARQREIGVRVAMGAGQTRIIRQLLMESCLLAGIGGAGGYALTVAVWVILPAIAPVSIPRLIDARADGTILGFALALAVVNGILFGIAPALRLAGKKGIGRQSFGVRGAAPEGRDHTRSFLVGAEIAISVVLVVVGGGLLTSFIKLVRTSPGFEATNILASVVLPAPERYRDPEKRASFYKRILDSTRVLPGVQSVGTVDALPFSGENNGGSIAGSGGVSLEGEIDIAGGDYLQTMGVRLLEGRWFREDEMAESNNSAIVNDFSARRLWPASQAVGQRVCVGCTPENPNNWKRVIGVVSSMRHARLDETPKGNVYLSAGAMRTSAFLVVRSNHPMADLEKAIRRTIASIDPNQPVLLSAPMNILISDSVASQRFVMLLLTAMAGLGLIMSAAGVYGVVSYNTSRRTQEIGIRVAVGAMPWDILSLVFRQGYLTVIAGLAVGLGIALVTTRSLSSFVPGLEIGNQTHVWVATGFVAITAGIACWLPARRATRIDPMSALRQE